MRRNAQASGFTLLEMLVVVTIMGIFIGVAVLSTDLVDFDTEMQREARRLENVIKLASEDALLLSRDYGLKFYADGYDFLVYDHAAGIWQPIEGDSVLVRHMLDRMLFELRVEDRDVRLAVAGAALMARDAAEPVEDDSGDDTGDEDDEELLPVPDVVIYSSGEITPFEIRIVNGIEEFQPKVLLSVEFDGKTEVGHDDEF